MKAAWFLVASILLATPLSWAEEGEWSGNIGLQTRFFAKAPLQEEQDRHNASASMDIEYFRYLNDGQQMLVASAFGRWDLNDDERSHWDIQELYWWGSFEQIEVFAGIRKVFWGVTETVHLVDVINQDDRLENIDGEDKLGQLMTSTLFEQDWGTIEAFVLLGFREAEFYGSESRLRPALPIDEDAVTYDAKAEEKHIDFALRYSHVIGDIDLGLSYFRGTDRDPIFTVSSDNTTGEITLTPHYQLIDQLGIDIQATKESWLWKFEAISGKVRNGSGYSAAVGGLEYTWFALDGASDLGVLLEYQFDDRENRYTDNDVALGLRWALNNTQSTEMLLAISSDLDNQTRFLSFEANHRLSDFWYIESEIRAFSNVNVQEGTYDLRLDDYLQVEVKRFF